MSDVPATSVSIPRFGVKHIMLWTLCSGLQLVAAKWIFSEELKKHAPSEQLQHFADNATPYVAIGAIVVGLVLAAMCILLTSWFQGRRPLLAVPGHWVVFNLVLILVFDMAMRAILLRFTYSPMSMQEYLFQEFVLSFGHWLTTMAYVWAAIVQTLKPWRVLLAAAALVELTYCLLIWFEVHRMGLSFALPGLSLLTLIMSILYIAQSVREARQGLKRDWVHQTGVYGLFVFALLGSLNYFVFR